MSRRKPKSLRNPSTINQAGCILEPTTPKSIAYNEHLRILRESTEAAVKPLLSYREFLAAKEDLEQIKRRIENLDEELTALRNAHARVKASVDDFAKKLRDEANEALR